MEIDEEKEQLPPFFQESVTVCVFGCLSRRSNFKWNSNYFGNSLLNGRGAFLSVCN